jgi:hypothetical protein
VALILRACPYNYLEILILALVSKVDSLPTTVLIKLVFTRIEY